MAKKNVVAIVKIQIPAGQASPAPPVGTALGPHGVAIMDFCKEYNAKTEDKRGTIIPVEISIYEDRTFSFITKTPPATFLIKRAINLKSGSKEPGKISAGTITRSQLADVANIKMVDLNANDLDAAIKIIEGSARAMGLQVVEG